MCYEIISQYMWCFITNNYTMKLLIHYLKPYKFLAFITLLLAATNQIFSMLDPYFLGKIIDNYATKAHQYSQSEYISGVGFYILCIVSVAMISRIAKNFQDYCMNIIIQKFGAKVYTDGLQHTLKLPYQEFEDQKSGETLSVLQKVRTDSERFILLFINLLFTSIVGLTFVFIYALKINWLLIPIYFVGSVMLWFITNFLRQRVRKIQQHIVQQTTVLAGSTTESLRNIELVKSLGLAKQEINRLNNATNSILNLELEKVRYMRSMSFIQGTFVNALRQAILFVILYFIFKQTISVGQLITLQMYSFFIFGPLQELGQILTVYSETEVSLERFQQLLDKKIEVKPQKPIPLPLISTLEFKNVSFKHQSAAYAALDNVSFSVTKGETIAFVGPSGSGKTTLVKLLVGLYTPIDGAILYNHNDSKNIDYDEFRKLIGFVTQDTQLFSGSIKDNLLFVKTDATNEQIFSALEKASCQNLLARAENGIDTVIGEGGIKISGGEKQRLSIARALIREPQILVFDEATSALDSITEEEISYTIREIGKLKNQITVLIAHRLSTIMHADCIYVLEKGAIVEMGRHEELINEKGLYYAMWRQQIGERKNYSTPVLV